MNPQFLSLEKTDLQEGSGGSFLVILVTYSAPSEYKVLLLPQSNHVQPPRLLSGHGFISCSASAVSQNATEYELCYPFPIVGRAHIVPNFDFLWVIGRDHSQAIAHMNRVWL